MTSTPNGKRTATLKDLLEAISAQKSIGQPIRRMLRAASEHISACLGKPDSVISMAQLVTVRPLLKPFLVAQGNDPISVRIYLNCLQLLLESAEKLGLMGGIADLQRRWREVLEGRPIGVGIWFMNWAISQEVEPERFGLAELKLCEDHEFRHGRPCSSLSNASSYLRKLMAQRRIGSQAAGAEMIFRKHLYFGAPLSEIGQPLRGQIEELLAPPVAGGDRDCGHDIRPATKKSIREFLCRFVGYVTGVRGVKISSLDQLLTRDRLEEFVRWCQDSRDVKTNGIKADLARLHAAVAKSKQPALAGKDFHWIRELMWCLRREPASQIRQRKAAKWIDYELLEQIPAKIHARAEALPCHQSRQYAALRRDELLFRWLLILPWRSRNLRECRVGEEAQGGNLFKCELTPFFTVAKPDWVKQALRVNPQEKFWMFYFREHETKGGREVRSVLPEQLVAPLEEYLRDYRPVLLGNNNEACPPLFPNAKSGGPLAAPAPGKLVAWYTLCWTGKRLHASVIRDIVALTWLDNHPDDYLTVAGLLWHQDVLNTLQVYGWHFQESGAICRMEAWLKRQQ